MPPIRRQSLRIRPRPKARAVATDSRCIWRFAGCRFAFLGRDDDFLQGDALRAKVMRGGAWLGSGNVAEQATRFARNMVLTRLLAPSAFGAMAIVMSSSAIVAALTEVGMKQAVIQGFVIC